MQLHKNLKIKLTNPNPCLALRGTALKCSEALDKKFNQHKICTPNNRTSGPEMSADMKLFAIRDSKGQFYGAPFAKRTPGEAERDFTQLAQDQQSTISKFPLDYDLFELGDYNELTGKITAKDSPHHICKAVDLLPKQ